MIRHNETKTIDGKSKIIKIVNLDPDFFIRSTLFPRPTLRTTDLDAMLAVMILSEV